MPPISGDLGPIVPVGDVVFDLAAPHRVIARGVEVRIGRLREIRCYLDMTLSGEIVGIRIESDKDISTRVFRSLPLRELARQALPHVHARWIARVGAEVRGLLEREPELARGEQPVDVERRMQGQASGSLASAAAQFDGQRRPGRRGRPDSFYAAIAARYVALCITVDNPVEALADEMGYSSSQVRNLLTAARRRQLLTASPPGRAGGELTDAGRAALDEGED